MTAAVALMESLVLTFFFSHARDMHKIVVCLWKFCIQMFCSRPDMKEIANEQNSNDHDEAAYSVLKAVILQ